MADQEGNEPAVAQHGMFVDGVWHSDVERDWIDVENPATERVIAKVQAGVADDAHAALVAARRAQPGWAALPAIERGRLVSKIADAVAANAEDLARTVVEEQGKPIGQARGEIGAAETFLRYAAENARRIEGDILPSDHPGEEIWIRRVPHGVVVGLTAWNYPAALAARKLGPALVAGNTFVLLSHEATPLSGLALARLAEAVELPKGVFNVVTGRGPVVGRALVESPLSDLITLTGSTRAGREVYGTGAERLKVLRLELGGKAPFIVMDDADLEVAVDAAIGARFANCGQVCTCSERLYLHRDVADRFMEAFLARVNALRIGDPLGDPDLGPKVNADELDKIEEIVAASIDAGAEVLVRGGRLRDGAFAKGHWYAPTVLAVRDNRLPVMQREVFGPVVPVMTFADFDDALALANDTPFGLSAYLFTTDMDRVMRVHRELRFGEVYVNRGIGEQVQGFHTGWGLSGLGGEDGRYGFDSYLRKQTAYVNWASRSRPDRARQ
ncbi:MAG: aldehyde dehydrogenase family protein [Pseudomonadota bacterium]